MTCTVSWLRLESWVLGELDPTHEAEVRAHVQTCLACRRRLEAIEHDDRPLPALPGRSRWRRWIWPAVAAAAAVLLVWLRPSPEPQGFPPPTLSVKGGELELVLVVLRDGRVWENPGVVRPGDRLQAEVTCPPGRHPFVLNVFEGGEETQLAAGELPCGNRVPVGGAFMVSEDAGPMTVCVTLDDAADRTVCRSLEG